MHRSDTFSLFLLYIEPKIEERLEHPINDALTRGMEVALTLAEEGAANYSNLESEGEFRIGARYKGVHYTVCREASSNTDFRLPSGFITNSLAPYYLRWYRNSIPKTDLPKLACVLSDTQLNQPFTDRDTLKRLVDTLKKGELP